MSNWYIKLGIWVIVIGGIFAFLWQRGYLARLATYIGETREELRKCTWPTLDELTGSTVVVMVAMGLLALFTVGADLILARLIRLML